MRRIFRLPRRHRVERDVDDEIGFHLAMREAKLRQAGWRPTMKIDPLVALRAEG